MLRHGRCLLALQILVSVSCARLGLLVRQDSNRRLQRHTGGLQGFAGIAGEFAADHPAGYVRASLARGPKVCGENTGTACGDPRTGPPHDAIRV